MGERRGLLVLFSILALFLFVPPALPSVHADDALTGHVFDAATGLPVAGATVKLCSTAMICVTTTQTDATGRFAVSLSDGFHGRVYVYHNDTATPGFDYVPAFRDVSGAANLTFNLTPAGTLLVEGDIHFVDIKEPSKLFFITVLDPDTGRPPHPDTVTTFGVVPAHPLDLNPRHVIVPAETPVVLLVNASVLGAQRQDMRSFVAGSEAPFLVDRSQVATITVLPHLFQFNRDWTMDLYLYATSYLAEFEAHGFYVNLERRDLTHIMTLVARAEGETAEGEYGASNADIREAYLATNEVIQRLQDIDLNAASSSLLLTVFLAFMSLGVVFLLVNPWVLKAALGAVLYAALLGVLFAIYPGVKLVASTLLLQYAGLAFILSLVLSYLTSRFLQDHVVHVFTMAKQNVKRRRLRFFLTLIPVTILAMSFVALTSFATGYGLTVVPQLGQTAPANRLVVRQPLPSPKPETVTFYALDASTVPWLRSQRDVATVAPKAENFPIAALNGLGTLSTSTDPATPSVENELTRIDDSLTLVEGRHLQDGDVGVLLSATMVDRVGVQVGDVLRLQQGRTELDAPLIGIFMDASLRDYTDVDGRPMIPKKVEMYVQEEGVLTTIAPCDPSEVLLMDWETAIQLSSVALSRVAVAPDGSATTLPLARRIALERSLWVWSAVDGRVFITSLGEYVEAKGLTIAIPWFIVIMAVVVTMLNAIYERRREVAILSSVGLNPSHIRGLFIAESAIIGVLGGGAGYLLGLGSYRAMTLLDLAVEVRQKVSAIWSFGTLGVSIIAVVVGALIAIRYSVVITPSFLRKWTEGERSTNHRAPMDLIIPISPLENELDSLLLHLRKRIMEHFRSKFSGSTVGIDDLNDVDEFVEDDATSRARRLRFNYLFGQGSTPFELLATKRRGDDAYTVRLFCQAGEIYDVATAVRMAAVEWSARKE
jgi:hypothetical protein